MIVQKSHFQLLSDSLAAWCAALMDRYSKIVFVASFLLVGLPTYAQFPPFPPDACSRTFLDFTDANQYLSVATSPLVGSSGTFEGWIRRDNWSAHADNIIFSNGIDYNTDHSLYLSLHSVGLHFRYGMNAAGQGTAAYNSATLSLTAGTWHHVAATWNHESGTTTIRVFLDGSELENSTVDYLISPGSTLLFGSNPLSANFGDGSMAEFRFWSFAKSASEITDQMNTVLNGDEIGLIGYWPMNDIEEAATATNLVEGGDGATFVQPTASLTWQSLFPISLSADGENRPAGATFNFGNVGGNESSESIIFTLKNESGSTINLPNDPAISLGGANADQFAIDLTGSAGTLAAGASTTFSVVFNPTSLGVKTATVNIGTVTGCDDTFVLNLAGTGVASLSYSGPGFREASANDGSVEGSITIVLSGDTFQDTDANNLLDIGTEVIITTVPAGLTPVLTLNGNTEAVLTLTGNAASHQNSNDVAEIVFDFDGIAFTGGIAPEAVSSGLGIDFTINPTITYSGDGFTESSANDGTLEGSITITLEGDTFQDDDADGLLDIGTEVTVNNIPGGLTPVISITNTPGGSVWETAGSETGREWRSVAYGDGQFVAVSYYRDVPVMTSPDGNNWTDRITGLEDNFWQGVTYGNGLFVAVASYGANQVMTSDDGITWTGSMAAEANSWQSVTYGNGLFVAVASNGTNRVMTSPNGITWTARSAAEANSWQSVTFGDNLFVAVAYDGTNSVMTSPDGITWTSQTAAEANTWVSVTYGDGQFVAVAYSGVNRVMTSPDGITWTARQAGEANSWLSVTYGNGHFVAVASDGTNSVMTSPDGVNWTSWAVGYNQWIAIAYGNDRFVAVGADYTKQVMSSSAIGRGEAELTLSGKADSHQTADEIGDITFEFTEASFSTLLAEDVIGSTGPASSGLGINFASNPSITYSGDGFNETSSNNGSVTGSITITLTGDTFQDDDEDGFLDPETEVSLGNVPAGLTPEISITENVSELSSWSVNALSGNQWRSVAYGNGLFVSVSSDGEVVTSPDGETWTYRTAPEANAWYSVTYGDGLFVAVAISGTNRVMTSPDGITWTSRLVPQFTGWSSVTYGDGQFVAVAYSGVNRVMTSPDGITWTARQAAEANSWVSVTHGNGMFVAVSETGTNRVMTSPDGITWTARSAAEANAWRSVTYGKGLFVAVSQSGSNRMMTSPDGITWTARQTLLPFSWVSVTYAYGQFVTVSASSAFAPVMTSPDGINWTLNTVEGFTSWWAVTGGGGRLVAIGQSGKVMSNQLTFSGTAELVFTGQAITHTTTADVTDILFEFTDAAFSSSTASHVLNATGQASSMQGINFGDGQTITFGELPAKTFGDEVFELTATASSGLDVTYTSSNENVVTISGSTVTIVGGGTVTITASQVGDDDYTSAEDTEQILMVNKATQLINFGSLDEKTFEEEGYFILDATATSGLDITYFSSDESIAQISGDAVLLMGAGTATITAFQPGNSNYLAAENVGQVLVINKANQTITFGELPEKTFGDEDFQLEGTVFSDDRIVTYVSSDETVATILDETVTIVGAGSTIITASQSGDSDYNPAPNVEQVLTVNKGSQTISFSPLSEQTFGEGSEVELEATSSSWLDVTYTSSNEELVEILEYTAYIKGAGAVTITASQSGNENYLAAPNVVQTLIINKANQSIYFPELPSKTFGDESFELVGTETTDVGMVTYTSSDETVATLSGKWVTIVGSGEATITASQGGDTNYNPGEVEQVLIVNKAPQTITFNELTSKTYGDATFNLSASGGATGNEVTFVSSNTSVATISGNTVTIVGAGTTTITASQAGNSNYLAATDVAQTLTVNKADQTITFGTLEVKTFEDTSFDLSATGGASGNDVSLVSSNTSVATISGNTVTIVGAGTATITASQTGNDNYLAAPDVAQTLTVNKAAQTITFGTLEVKTFEDTSFDLSATGGASGNDVSFVSSNTSVATISGNTVTIVGAGTAIITASQTGNDNYLAAPDVAQTLTVNKAAQTITFGSLTTKTYGGAPFELVATGGASGNDVSFVSSNTSVATISGNTVTIVGAGTATITASQTGSDNYLAAADVAQTLTVNKAAQTITFNALIAKTYGDATFNLSATGGASGNAVTFVSSNTSVATISGNTVTIVGAGTATITASQTGSDNYLAAADVAQTLTVNKAAQAITFNALIAKTHGDAPFNLSATGGASGNAVSYVSSNTSVATISGNTVTIVGAGTATITASQMGSDNYLAATDVVQTLTVNKAAQAITFGSLSTKTYGDATFNLSATGGASGNAVTFVSSNTSVATISGNTVTIVGAGTATITASQTGTDNYLAATDVAQTLTVNKADQTITFSSLSAKTYGDAPFELSATGGASGNALVFTSDNPDVATVSGATVTVVGSGTATILASQAGNSNFEAPPAVSQILNVNKAGQSITFEAPSTKIYGDEAFTLTATSDSEQAIVFTSSNLDVATVSGATVTIIGAGSTTLTATQDGGQNFESASTSRTLIVEQASLTVSAIDQTISEGDEIPSLSLQYEGFVHGEDESVLDEAPLVTTAASSQSPTGVYTIEVTGGSDQNYAIVRVNATLTILSGEVTLGTQPDVHVVLFPNPAVAFVTVRAPQRLPVTIYNLSGQLVIAAYSNEELDVSEWLSGVYLIQVEKQLLKLVKP